MRERSGSLSRFLALLTVAVLLAGCVTGVLAEEFVPSEGYSRVVEVPGLGEMQYYAQNDPMWADAIYEPYDGRGIRIMSRTGCGPTVVAMALANLLTPEELTSLLSHARTAERGYSLCPHSVNGLLHKTEDHRLFYPQTGEDFVTYLPMIIAAYATGNNDRNIRYRQADSGGTSIDIFEGMARVYGLRFQQTKDLLKANEMLRDGCAVITTAVAGPFTKESHYMLFAGIKWGWVYVLDPAWREVYDNDPKGILDVVEPGLVRFRVDDYDRVEMYNFYVYSRPDSE